MTPAPRCTTSMTSSFAAGVHPVASWRAALPRMALRASWCSRPVMPTITTGNTMAPCVLIGERAATLLLRAHDAQHTSK
jgi:hypothetical protein